MLVGFRCNSENSRQESGSLVIGTERTGFACTKHLLAEETRCESIGDHNCNPMSISSESKKFGQTFFDAHGLAAARIATGLSLKRGLYFDTQWFGMTQFRAEYSNRVPLVVTLLDQHVYFEKSVTNYAESV